MRSGGRVVEGARLESVYTSKAYRGFESHPLRQAPPALVSACTRRPSPDFVLIFWGRPLAWLGTAASLLTSDSELHCERIAPVGHSVRAPRLCPRAQYERTAGERAGPGAARRASGVAGPHAGALLVVRVRIGHAAALDLHPPERLGAHSTQGRNRQVLSILYQTSADTARAWARRRAGCCLAAGSNKVTGERFGRRRLRADALCAVARRDRLRDQRREIAGHRTRGADSAALPVATRIGDKRLRRAAAAKSQPLLAGD